MDSEKAVGLVCEALGEALQEEWGLAFRHLRDAVGDGPEDGYAVACVLAVIVSSSIGTGSPEKGRMMADVIRLPGATPEHQALVDAVQSMAAFVTAQANGDDEGSILLYHQVCEAGAESLMLFWKTLFESAVAAVRPVGS